MLNPLDAICNTQRTDAICVNQLNHALEIEDKGLLQEKPDLKVFLPFRFHLYTPEDVFQPHTYNRFLGIIYLHKKHFYSLTNEHYYSCTKW